MVVSTRPSRPHHQSNHTITRASSSFEYEHQRPMFVYTYESTFGIIVGVSYPNKQLRVLLLWISGVTCAYISYRTGIMYLWYQAWMCTTDYQYQ